MIETPISILSDPIQFIKPLVRNLINKSRGLHASATRTALATCPIVDFQILRTCISKVPDEDDSRIIRNHVAQAGWTTAQLFDLDRLSQGVSCVCVHCGQERPDSLHLYKCPAMAEVVRSVIPTFDQVLALDLPPHLFAGVPHALPADPRFFFQSA